MKYIHYFTATICTLILLVFMIMPFGGPSLMLEFVTDGFYGKELFNNHNISYDSLLIVWLDKLIGLIFWSCIFINIILLFFRKMDMKTKGKISLICLIILLLITFASKFF